MDIPVQEVRCELNASSMNNFKRFLTVASVCLILIVDVPSTNAYSSNQYSAIFKKGDCGLTVEDPHISDSLLKKKIVAIKVNVTSNCIYPQQKVVFEISLLRKGTLGWKIVKSFPAKAITPSSSPYKIEYKDSFVVCTNTKKTIYMARATAKATIGGKIYISPLVYSNETPPIACGF